MPARELAHRIERDRRLDDTAGERFSGYGLVGLGFESGHVLAFRRYAASSIGPPFTTVWQRDPDGLWTFHANVDPSRSCARYFGPALHGAHSDEIELQWTGAHELWVRARDARLHLALRLTSTAATRVLGAAARLLPRRCWLRTHLSTAAAALAQSVLQADGITLSGSTPSGHGFSVRPTAIWRVAAAAAVLRGRDLGAVTSLPAPILLGDFRIPTQGLLIACGAEFSEVVAGGKRQP